MRRKRPFLLYHWSPVSRRRQILRYGLRPGCRSRDHEWRPPYICFSDSPSLAWALSGDLSDIKEEWDLWMVLSNMVGPLRRLEQPCRTTPSRLPTEWRSSQRVPKRCLWRVGSRWCEGK